MTLLTPGLDPDSAAVMAALNRVQRELAAFGS
jgi:hypothetical protein